MTDDSEDFINSSYELQKRESYIEKILITKLRVKQINSKINDLRERLKCGEKLEILSWIDEYEDRLNIYKAYLRDIENEKFIINNIDFPEDILDTDDKITAFCELKNNFTNVKEEIKKLTKELSDLKSMRCSCRDQFDEFERSDKISKIEDTLFIYNYYLEKMKK
jgi:uncharacterized protein (DUF342 family)